MKKIILYLVVFFGFVGYSNALETDRLLERAGENREEVEKFIEEADKQGYKEWADFLLSSMPDVDLVNLKSDDFISYFDALSKNRERIPWKKEIDDFLFQYYILPHRVSQEPLENFTVLYADSLYELIDDVKDMRKAVLRINEWVFTQMKYEPTARWDQNSLVTIKRGFGRCEEMAILCIKALRAVCIPSRKVYSPWWPFTNSNHAWVEVWINGKWHYIGGGEPTDLENAWFFIAAKRAAIIKGVVYGEMEPGNEIIYKKEEGFTIINTTPNYSDVTELLIRVLENGTPAESVSVSICVYNYSSLPPVGLKKTGKDGFVTFNVGKTDLFVFVSKDSLIGYDLWKPSTKERDTLTVAISKKEFPDTSFWIYTHRIEAERKKPEYKPNRDSLKLLQERHFCKISLVDSSLASSLSEEDKKLTMIFYHAKGGGKSLLKFYKGLSDSLKEVFIDYFNALHSKDIVSLDTTGLLEELLAVQKSREFAKSSIPDSIIEDYLISDRILFEEIGKWRKGVQSEFMNFRNGNVGESVNDIFLWTEKNVLKIEKKGYFGPTMNTEDVYRIRRGTDTERYIFIAGILRSVGIPARVKWSYDALEYWDKEWKEKCFEEKKEEGKKAWVAIKFDENGKDITKKQRYYYDYSMTRFKKYPERLDPPVDTTGGIIIVTLDEEPVYNITGWRNAYGDTYVRIKGVFPRHDTTEVVIKTGIPEDIKPGDLIVRKYVGFDLKGFGIKNNDVEKGNVLITVFDTESEASRSTLKNAQDVINNFSGKVFLFADVEKRESAEHFLEEMGIVKGSLYTVTEEIYKKRWKIRDIPSVIYLKDGKCVFWVEGLFLHLTRLMENLQ
ncbi:transglutaminase domain-containing protein [candidate division WOR-3 bacterium]|nr:transglutaminase domain-containing protein [candidate division WOR-3 bacterium]